MGLISTLLNTVFGGHRNVLRETAEVFRENAENAGQRDATGSRPRWPSMPPNSAPHGRGST